MHSVDDRRTPTVTMGQLRSARSGRTVLLGSEHVIGRAPSCTLRLNERYVSAHHAAIRWQGHAWTVRDHGSRNGTFLNGTRLRPGEDKALQVGSLLAFGRFQDAWELVDDSRPVIMAIPLDGGDPAVVEGDILAVPSSEDPQAMVCPAADGSWTLESPDDDTNVIQNLQAFRVGGRRWRLCSTDAVGATLLESHAFGLHVRDLAVSFATSSDEQVVELAISDGKRTLAVASDDPHTVLLALARRRQADTDRGLPAAARGWTYADELMRGLGIDLLRLNREVLRIRQEFATLPVDDSFAIVERRNSNRELRIGTEKIVVTRR